MTDVESMLEALDDCLKIKRNRISSNKFEANKELLLVELVEQINKHEYVPHPAYVFIVTKPKPREVFAPSFRDRVVDHWISLRLMPILENVLIKHTYSCMKNRGAHTAVDHFNNVMKNNPDSWSASFDISGYFSSLNRLILWDKVSNIIQEYYRGSDKEELLHVNKVIIFHDITKDCVRKSPTYMWNLLPASKSLFNTTIGIGIGRLVSQIYGNVYLNDFDHVLEKMFGINYIRYVDDFKVCDDHNYIIDNIPTIRTLLKEWKLKLHPNKFSLLRTKHGIDCLGFVIKQGRKYLRNSTIYNIRLRFKSIVTIKGNLSVINSYLGIMQHCNIHDIRTKIVNELFPEDWINWGNFRGDVCSFRINSRLKKIYLV